MIKINAKWFDQYHLNHGDTKEFYRSDTASITGNVTGNDISNLSIKATVVYVTPQGDVKAWSKETLGDNIIINNVNDGLSFFEIKLIEKNDTTNYMHGDRFKFDIEFETTNERQTLSSSFTIKQDYTLN